MKRVSNKIIIVGGGARGLFFAQMLTNELNREVAAIVDTHIEGHEAIRQKLIENHVPSVPVYGSLDDVLTVIPRSEADTLFIMTPE